MGFIICTMPCWITLSITVGIPSFLTPPLGLGISTLLTGWGLYSLRLPLYWYRLFCKRRSYYAWVVSFLTVLTLPCVLSPFRFHGFALSCCSLCSFTFRPSCRQVFHEAYIRLHGYIVQPFGLRLLWLLLTSHDKSLSTAGGMLQPIPASVRPHGHPLAQSAVLAGRRNNWSLFRFLLILSVP